MIGLSCKKAKYANETRQRVYRKSINALCVCTIVRNEIDNCIVFAKGQRGFGMPLCAGIAGQRNGRRPTKNCSLDGGDVLLPPSLLKMSGL